MTSSCPNLASENLGKAPQESWGRTPIPSSPAQPRVGAGLERRLGGELSPRTAGCGRCTPSAGGAPSPTRQEPGFLSASTAWTKSC